MERNQNYVELWGVAESDPVFSHENHTRRFDKFPLRVERLSGQSDVPVIVASEALLRVCPVKRGRACASQDSSARSTTGADRAASWSSRYLRRASNRATVLISTAFFSRARCAKSPHCAARRSDAASVM